MKQLLLGMFLVAAAVLTSACGDNGSSDQSASPTVGPGSATPASTLSADEVITLTQELSVLYKVDKPDGTFELKPSTINERVDVLCADDASWSAEDKGREWRVYAQCKAAEPASGGETPPSYGFKTLGFEWIYYPSSRQVMPVSQASHDAQYPFPQPSVIPSITPLPTLTP